MKMVSAMNMNDLLSVFANLRKETAVCLGEMLKIVSHFPFLPVDTDSPMV